MACRGSSLSGSTGTANASSSARRPSPPKFGALSSRPNFALSIDTGDSPETAKTLSVRGVAAMDTVDGVAEEYIAAAAQSYDPAQLAEFERSVCSTYKQMVRISIEPMWVRFDDYGAGRVPRFLTELASHH